MPLLEISHITGDRERRELNKKQPLTIGSHSSCDIVVDEDTVEMMHCRISWGKNAFEAVAVGVEGLDHNGNPAQRANLKSGDILRFGSVDIKFLEDGAASAPVTKAKPGAKATKPLADDLDDLMPPLFDDEPAPKKVSKPAAAGTTKPAPAPAAKAPAKPVAKPTRKTDEDLVSPDKLMQSLELLAQDSHQDIPVTKGKSKRPSLDDDLDDDDGNYQEYKPKPVAAKPVASAKAVPAKPAAKPAAAAPATKPVAAAPAAKAAPVKPAPKDADFDDDLDEIPSGEIEDTGDEPMAPVEKPKVKPRGERVRPGEQSVMKSPLVLGLGGAVVLLALSALTFWIVGTRQTTAAEFADAKALVTEQKYNVAITTLEKFIERHPEDPAVDEALVEIGYSKIDSKIMGATPNWTDGLKEVKAFMTQRREKPNFDEQKTKILERASKMALGAAQDAGKAPFNAELIGVSSECIKLVEQLSPKDQPPAELVKSVETISRQSNSAILRNTTFTGQLGQIEAAIKAGQPMAALQQRRALLAKYTDLANDPKVRKTFEQTLETERGLVKLVDVDQPALTDEIAADSAGLLTLLFNARIRTDQVSEGEVVLGVSKDCLYAIDTVTGFPVWRRSVGLDLPFFPIVENSLPSAIVFSTSQQELQRVHLKTGAIVWRQPLADQVRQRPLIEDEQVYVSVSDNSLLKIDLETGAISAKLTFSQPVSSPTPLADGEHMICAGSQEVVYTLSKRPLGCVAVSSLGHADGSVEAPLLSVANYVLLIENTAADAGKLRLLQPESLRMKEVATAPIAGRVLDDCAIRGRNLFVPSTGERVSAYTISDDPGEAPLNVGPIYQVQGGPGTPVYLTTGPDQVWMASSALRKLGLTTDALQAEENTAAIGFASQPLIQRGGVLYNARRRLFGDAVFFTLTDRDTLVSDWQAVLGGGLLAWNTDGATPPSLVAVSEAGNTFRVNAKALSEGGFISGAIRLPLNNELAEPLVACPLSDGQVAVASGGPEPKLWIISKLGQIERQADLPALPQANPVAMGKRLVIPLAGRLHMPRTLAGEGGVQDYMQPAAGDAPPRWKQILGVDETNAIAITEAGQVIHVRQQKNPKPHLAEVTVVELGAAVQVAAGLGDGLLAVADANNRVVVYDANSLEPKGEKTFAGPIMSAVQVAGGQVFVNVSGELHCLSPDMQPVWQHDLEGHTLAGRPLVTAQDLIVTRGDGHVLWLNKETGAVAKTASMGTRLASGVMQVGEEQIVIALDGSLVRIGGGQ